MTIFDLIVLLIVAGVCGALGQAISGYSRGGCLVSIALGFVGAGWESGSPVPWSTRTIQSSDWDHNLPHRLVDHRLCPVRRRDCFADSATRLKREKKNSPVRSPVFEATKNPGCGGSLTLGTCFKNKTIKN